MKNLLVLTLLSFAFFSCSEDNFTEESLGEKSITVVYQGKTFFPTINDNGKIMENKRNETIKNALATKHVVNVEEDTFFLFDTLEEADSYFNIKEKAPNDILKKDILKKDTEAIRSSLAGTTRTGLHPEFNYGGSYAGTLDATPNGNNTINIGELRKHGWHDRISSLTVTNSTNSKFILRLYEHAYFRGRTFTVITPLHKVSFVPNLHNSNFNNITSGITGWYNN